MGHPVFGTEADSKSCVFIFKSLINLWRNGEVNKNFRNFDMETSSKKHVRNLFF